MAGLSLSPSQQGLGILDTVTKLKDKSETAGEGPSTQEGDQTNKSLGEQQERVDIKPQFESVGQWLASLELQQYETILVSSGYDHMLFLVGLA